MNTTIAFIRICFIFICILFLTTYTTTTLPGGFNFSNSIIGLFAGLTCGVLLIIAESLLKQVNLRAFTTAIIGLFFGYLLGQIVLLSLTTVIDVTGLVVSPDILIPIKIIAFLIFAYLGMVITARASEEFYVSIPFVKLNPPAAKKTDLLIDTSILMDGRIIELANSGILDHHLIFPRFALKELNTLADSTDETLKTKGKRALEILKKLETMPTLDLRYSDVDFPETDSIAKLVQLARLLNANIITGDISRLQQAIVDGIRVINISIPTNILKPLTQAGEFLNIKVQRYGKEPRQGVGYLDDGTMVVINGGAEFIGETIKTQVLSIKHTASGRMIFCNSVTDFPLGVGIETEDNSIHMQHSLENQHKDYCTL